MNKSFAIAVLFSFLASITANGQAVVVQRSASADPFFEATIVSGAVSQAVPAGAAGAQQAAAAQANDPQKKRIQKLKQLQFDRRPSAILKAWIELAAEKEEAKAAEKEEKEEKKPDAPMEKEEEEKKPDAAAEKKEEDEKSETSVEKKEDKDKKPDATPQQKEEDTKPEKTPDKAAAEEPATDKDTPEQTAAEKEAAEKAAAAKKAQEELAKAEKEFDERLKTFQRNVTLGVWTDVKAFLASLSEEEAKAGYDHLLDSLRSGPPRAGQRGSASPQQAMMLNSANAAMMQAQMAARGQGPGAAFVEKNVFSLLDVVGLIDSAPYELDQDVFAKLGTILQLTLAAGHDLEELLPMLGGKKEQEEDESQLLNRRQVALLLFAAQKDVRAGDYLPDVEKARADDDREALNLLSRHYLALHAKEKKTEHLEQAWAATQAVLAVGEVDKKEKEQALKRAVELAPRIREELGQKWLDESFTNRIERGREIVATIGSAVSMALQSYPTNADYRLKALRLQRTAVEALLKASAETATEWRETLNLLANNWLIEAQVTYQLDQSSRLGPQWQRDRYGNYFFLESENPGMQMRYPPNSARPIPTGDLLETSPSEAWLALVHESLKPKFSMTFSKLYLKVNEDAKAFPYIEQLATTHPDIARDLAHEFLRVWTANHNPNEARDRRNPYMYIWGYQRRAERIPLTRSKQQRNLKDLSQWVRRLRALPIEELDETLLTRAFTTSHSTAEVYRLEAIEDVFGSIDNLKPKTLAALIQQMRGNLGSVWRQPDVQKQNSTNRKQKDIQAEVLRGYEVARAVVRRGLEKYPEHWALHLAEAAILHDENDFDKQIERSSDFSERRQQALTHFQEAAELYAKGVGELSEDEETTQAFELWYYASLGAVDLRQITEDKVPDLRQPARIREAILALPGEAAERHMARFANNMFTRLSSLKPEMKFRYLRTGFEICGDHKRAAAARKVFDYYNDLVTEIKLEAKIDGSDVVAHSAPFGVFVNIVHTKEIERESGGFGRYLQNQNNQYYSYNYGRPTENYRDKFRDAATQALEEHFEVISVTFNDPEVNSKALAEYGWRATPYAYLLLKARGPEVDKIPPLHLDLDFLDTSGYAIIPIESPAVPIDASAEQVAARPVQDATIVQTLDERQADEGKLVLEVKATAHGLVPDLVELLELQPKGFDIVNVDDEGVSVSQFDKKTDETTVTSERLWMVSMRAKDDTPGRPTTFEFGTAKLPEAETTYQRYVDADLEEVEQVISLEQQYGETSYAWLWVPLVVLAVVVAAGVWLRRRARGRVKQEQPRFRMPGEVTAFTVLGLLRDIQHNNGLGESRRRELNESISRLEQHYFALAEAQEPDLRGIAKTWLERTG